MTLLLCHTAEQQLVTVWRHSKDVALYIEGATLYQAVTPQTNGSVIPQHTMALPG